MKRLLKSILLLTCLSASILLVNCDKDDNTITKEKVSDAHAKSKAKLFKRTGSEVSREASNFIKDKSNNSLRVVSLDNGVKLSNGSETSRETVMGTVDLTQEIVVETETSTKHTFNVTTVSSTTNSITNLVVVETETSIFEYFLVYTFQEGASINMTSNSLQLSEFVGTISSYNNDGQLTGTMTIDNGVVTNDGQITPDCPEEDDSSSGDGTSGPGDAVDIGSDGSNTDSNGGLDTSIGGGGWFADAEGGCGLSVQYKCKGGVYGNHASVENSNVPGGWCGGVNDNEGTGVLVVVDCDGNLIGSARTTDSPSLTPAPCDGPVGVILEVEDLLEDVLTDEQKECIGGLPVEQQAEINQTIFNYLAVNSWNDASKEFVEQSGTAVCGDGEVDFENELILDETFVTDQKLKCVYDKLKTSNSSLFKSTIGNFINNPKLKMTIKKGNCIMTDDACCDDNSIATTGVVNLIIEDTGGSVLEIAAMILHEAIHAEISRYVLLQAPNENVNDRPRILQLFKYYKAHYNEGDIEHVYMTEHYINPIASALRKLDNFSYPIDYYKSYAWDGLRAWDVNNLLSMEEDSNYNTYKSIVEANTSLSCD